MVCQNGLNGVKFAMYFSSFRDKNVLYILSTLKKRGDK